MIIWCSGVMFRSFSMFQYSFCLEVACFSIVFDVCVCDKNERLILLW